MKKNISFMRTIYTEVEIQQIQNYLEPIFDNDYKQFKEMIKNGSAYIQGNRFTYITHAQANKKYRIMGNCIGPIIYVRDIMNFDDPDTLYLDDNS